MDNSCKVKEKKEFQHSSLLPITARGAPGQRETTLYACDTHCLTPSCFQEATPLLHHTDQTVFIERLQGKTAYSFFLCSPARSPTRTPSVLRTHTVLGTSGWEKLPTGHAPWSSPPGVPGQRHSVIQEGSTLRSCPWDPAGPVHMVSLWTESSQT